jgi:HK97 family phage major capsid protein
MSDATRLKISQLKEATTNAYLFSPAREAGAPSLMLGRPIVTDVAMPAVTASSKPILFGDFSSGYAIRDVAEVRFERSEGFGFGSGLVTFRAVLRTDGRPVDGLAIRAYQASAT